METVEMDLMQAQIGSLATDLARLEAKVAEGGIGHVTFDYVLVATNPYGSQGIYAYHTNAPEVYAEYCKLPTVIEPGVKVESTSIIFDPMWLGTGLEYSTGFDTETTADYNQLYKVNEDGTCEAPTQSTFPSIIGYLSFKNYNVVIGADGSVWYYRSGN